MRAIAHDMLTLLYARIIGDHYAFVAGSLGASSELGLNEPDRGTYEELLGREIPGWGLVPARALPSGHSRNDTSPEQGYFPLDEATIESADSIMHINNGEALSPSLEQAVAPKAGNRRR